MAKQAKFSVGSRVKVNYGRFRGEVGRVTEVKRVKTRFMYHVNIGFAYLNIPEIELERA